MSGRLDLELTARGLFSSREKARAAIKDGLVQVNGVTAAKPSQTVDESSVITLSEGLCPYVSRGGWKLQRALEQFSVSPAGCVCGDAGASTGGFTDCLLQHGARKVYAIDVGSDQLAQPLRDDPRVVSLEQHNLRYMTAGDLPEALDLFTLDVSFISLQLVLPAVSALLKPDGQALCLIKPQFEAGRELVGKNGVVHGLDAHKQVLSRFLSDAGEAGFTVKALTWSPIKGPEGNIEFLGHLLSGRFPVPVPDVDLVVRQTYQALKG